MKFGVNYTPSGGWFHSWLDFDRDHVAQDLTAIRSLHVDHIRVFPLWPVLQPNRGLIRQQAIDDVVSLVEIARDIGLDVSVDIFQGHLSSFDFLPNWLTDWHTTNMFSNADVIESQQALARALTDSLSSYPNVTGMNLGNEIVQFAASRHPARHAITSAQADQWLTSMFATVHDAWPEGNHTHSFDDDLWFENDQPFTPAHAVNHGIMTTVHSWIFGKVGPTFGIDHPVLPWFARYLCELALAWQTSFDKQDRRIWLQEVGAPLTHITHQQAPTFLAETMLNLLDPARTIPVVANQVEGVLSDSPRTARPAVKGGGQANLDAITWWCSHDVSRKLLDFPEVEHTLGLIDSEGNIKPTGEMFAAIAQAYQHYEAPTHSGEPQADQPVLSVMLNTDGTNRDLTDPQGDFFAGWYDHVTNGVIPAIKLIHTPESPGT